MFHDTTVGLWVITAGGNVGERTQHPGAISAMHKMPLRQPHVLSEFFHTLLTGHANSNRLAKNSYRTRVAVLGAKRMQPRRTPKHHCSTFRRCWWTCPRVFSCLWDWFVPKIAPCPTFLCHFRRRSHALRLVVLLLLLVLPESGEEGSTAACL